VAQSTLLSSVCSKILYGQGNVSWFMIRGHKEALERSASGYLGGLQCPHDQPHDAQGERCDEGPGRGPEGVHFRSVDTYFRIRYPGQMRRISGVYPVVTHSLIVT